MEWVEVRNQQGATVWKSPEVVKLAIDRVENTIKILDLDTSQMLGSYIVRSGESILKMPNEEAVSLE